VEKEQKQKENDMSAVAEKKLNDAGLSVPEVALVVVPLPSVPVELEMPLALVQKPKKGKVHKKCLKAILEYNKKRRLENDEKIMNVIHTWNSQTQYKDTKGGMLINLHDALKMRGVTMQKKTIREHVLCLAKRHMLFCERMVYDPRRKYVFKKDRIPKGFFFEYYIALNGDAGERGLYEHVYYSPPDVDFGRKSHSIPKKSQ
jgi:hypothetical protein